MAELTDLRDRLRARYGAGADEIRETHRVHEHASSAIVRAGKPAA